MKKALADTLNVPKKNISGMGAPRERKPTMKKNPTKFSWPKRGGSRRRRRRRNKKSRRRKHRNRRSARKGGSRRKARRKTRRNRRSAHKKTRRKRGGDADDEGYNGDNESDQSGMLNLSDWLYFHPHSERVPDKGNQNSPTKDAQRVKDAKWARKHGVAFPVPQAQKKTAQRVRVPLVEGVL